MLQYIYFKGHIKVVKHSLVKNAVNALPQPLKHGIIIKAKASESLAIKGMYYDRLID